MRDSLGLNLPILIDGNYVFAERLAIEHLSMDRQTRNAESLYQCSSHSAHFSPLSHLAHHTHENKHENNEYDQFLAADKVMTDHIEVAMLMVFRQLECVLEVEKKSTVFGLNVPAKVIGKLRSYFKSFDLSSDTLR